MSDLPVLIDERCVALLASRYQLREDERTLALLRDWDTRLDEATQRLAMQLRLDTSVDVTIELT